MGFAALLRATSVSPEAVEVPLTPNNSVSLGAPETGAVAVTLWD